jgi:hypothetical protein
VLLVRTTKLANVPRNPCKRTFEISTAGLELLEVASTFVKTVRELASQKGTTTDWSLGLGRNMCSPWGGPEGGVVLVGGASVPKKSDVVSQMEALAVLLPNVSVVGSQS